MGYLELAENADVLTKNQVKAIQEVVRNNGVKELDKINKFNFYHRGIKTYRTKKGKSIRQQTVDNFVEREFEGKKMTGATKDVAWLNNAASVMFKRASFGFFAANIPSALKNSYGAKFQGMIEAAGGKHMNMVSFQKGNAWSYATMGELSFGGGMKGDESGVGFNFTKKFSKGGIAGILGE